MAAGLPLGACLGKGRPPSLMQRPPRYLGVWGGPTAGSFTPAFILTRGWILGAVEGGCRRGLPSLCEGEGEREAARDWVPL